MVLVSICEMGVANASWCLLLITDANGGFSFEGEISVANKMVSMQVKMATYLLWNFQP